MPEIRHIITDPANIRQSIHKKLTEAVASVFPIEGREYSASVSNISVSPINLSQNQQREAVMKRASAHDGLFGDITVKSRSTGKVVGKLTHQRLLNIPYFTNRYTVILDGNEYAIISQMRTKSGVYTRKRGNEEIESSFNLSKGANFKLIMDPDSGVFKVDILNHTLPAYAVLRILGAGPDDVRSAIGRELFEKNSGISEAQSARTTEVLYKNLVAYRDGEDSRLTPQEKNAAIRQYFAGTEIDPETTKLTLGSSHSHVSALTILAAMKRILQIYNNEGDVDERDNLEFQHIFSIEDLFAEVIQKAKEMKSKLVMKLNAFKPDSADAEKDLKLIFSAANFTKPIEHFITSSPLSRLPSQINPCEFLDTSSIITRLGEGAISSERAVPFETREVNYSYMGLIDPIAAPESFKVGIDVHCALGCQKGDDHEFYKNVTDCRTGKNVNMRAIDLFDKYVGVPDPLYLKEKKPSDDIAAVYRGKLVHVRRDKLDYQIPSPHDLCTVTTNSIPFMNANQGNRLLMGDKHIQQALPLVEPEARLVKSTMGAKGSTLAALGKYTLPKSPVDGVVSGIDDDYIYIRGTDGKTYNVDYDNNTPLATKTLLINTVTVKKGDKVTKGQVLADSNFTRDGELTMGRNLTVAYMPYYGYNHEDGVVLSESAAKKMTSVHSQKISLDITPVTIMGKDRYASAFPVNYTREQLDKLDESGVVVKGAVLNEGDPVILAMEDNKESRVNLVLGMLHKSLIHPYKDTSETYTAHYPGTVVAVEKTAKLINVVVKVEKPMTLGDKMAGSYGNKGVVAKIVPDDDMPRDESGKAVDAIFTSAGVISRINPGQILESALGKIAKKTGKKYEIENYSMPDYTAFVLSELKKHGVKDKETVTDPTTGRKIPNIFVGVQHCHKLFKTTDTNFAARGIEGAYDQNESPVGSGITGPKGMGGMEINALIGHNARALMRESTTLRSSKNTEFWKAFQAGLVAQFPEEKRNFTKFTAILQQAGVSVKRKGDDLIAAPLTDSDILSQSNGVISDGRRLEAKTMMPEPGGLFDPMKTGGLMGDKWTHFTLDEPFVNPLFEDAVKNLLRMSSKEFEDAAMHKGGEWIKGELNRIDVEKDLSETEKLVNSGALGKGKLDDAVKRVKYLRALRDLGKKPGDAYVLTVFPIIPPKFRTIAISNNARDIQGGDSNDLYRDAIKLNVDYKPLQEMGASDKDKRDYREAMRRSLRELTGVAAPESSQLRARNVKGAIDFLAGDNPKTGFFQSKVIYSKMNLSARATISPDNSLGMDEIGLPEETAWSMYKPFIIRSLSKVGYSVLQARDAVEERSDAAKTILLEEMEKRPVIINRAPSLWRHSILAAKPKLRSGANLLVNSLWEKSLNADYDGDAVNIHLPITDEAIEDCKKMFPSKQLFSDKKKGDLLEAPTNEPIIGLYKATENVGKPQGSAKVHKFRDVDEAWKAYYAGKLRMTDYVDIG